MDLVHVLLYLGVISVQCNVAQQCNAGAGSGEVGEIAQLNGVLIASCRGEDHASRHSNSRVDDKR